MCKTLDGTASQNEARGLNADRQESKVLVTADRIKVGYGQVLDWGDDDQKGQR